MNMPWNFVEQQGFLTLPIIVWMKMDTPKSKSSYWSGWTETQQDRWDWNCEAWQTGRGSSSAGYP
jgi:hypothetical protein